jgi:hypothetical protein
MRTSTRKISIFLLLMHEGPTLKGMNNRMSNLMSKTTTAPRLRSKIAQESLSRMRKRTKEPKQVATHYPSRESFITTRVMKMRTQPTM